MQSVRRWMGDTFSRKKFDIVGYEKITANSVLSFTINEVCVYTMLRISYDAGELPDYIFHIFILVLSLLEAIATPYLSWVGHSRRTCLVASLLALVTCTTFPLSFVSISSKEPGYDLCQEIPVTSYPLNVRTSLRLVMLALMAFSATLGRVIVFPHSIACVDQCLPRMTANHLGLTITKRILCFVIGYNMIAHLFKAYHWLLMVILLFQLALNTFIMFRMSLEVPAPEKHAKDGEMGRIGKNPGFFQTYAHIWKNNIVVLHTISAGIFAAALWGFGFYNEEFVKSKFLMPHTQSTGANVSDLLRYLVAGAFVTKLAAKADFTRTNNEAKIKTIASTLRNSIIVMIIFAILTIIRCSAASVTGLGSFSYELPQCSISCSCAPHVDQLQPVCVLDTMTTFYSPCQAGCTGRQDVNGTTVLTGCTCTAGSGLAQEGACGGLRCKGPYDLHQGFFTIIITLSVVVFMKHALVIIRSVDHKDQSLTFGIVFSFVAFCAFIGGHLLYTGIYYWTCAWRVGSVCKLQGTVFPLYMIVTTIFIILISVVINGVSLFKFKKHIANNVIEPTTSM